MSFLRSRTASQIFSRVGEIFWRVIQASTVSSPELSAILPNVDLKQARGVLCPAEGVGLRRLHCGGIFRNHVSHGHDI